MLVRFVFAIFFLFFVSFFVCVKELQKDIQVACAENVQSKTKNVKKSKPANFWSNSNNNNKVENNKGHAAIAQISERRYINVMKKVFAAGVQRCMPRKGGNK